MQRAWKIRHGVDSCQKPFVQQARETATSTLLKMLPLFLKQWDLGPLKTEVGNYSGPRATFVPPHRFLWPEYALKKTLQI